MRSRPSPLTQITSDFSTGVQRTVSDATAAIGATADALTTAVTNASTSAASQEVNFSGVPLAATTELTTQPGAPASAPVDPVTQVVSGLLAAIGLNLNVTNSPVPAVPPQTLMGVLELIRRETEATLACTMSPPVQPVLTAATTPDPSANVGPATAKPVQSPNLLVNQGAEVGDPSLSGYSAVTVPGWTVTGTPTVIEYGTLRRFPWPLGSPGPTLPAFLGFPSVSSEPAGGGQQFVGGGPVATSTLSRTVDLSGATTAIDQGGVPYELSGDLGGFFIDPSRASVTVNFLDANGVTLGTGALQPVTADRSLVPDQADRTRHVGHDTGGHPQRAGGRDLDGPEPGTRQLQQRLRRQRLVHLGAPLPAPPPPLPPASTVEPLDHVFLVYMENKGVTDIVGSPNAPYRSSGSVSPRNQPRDSSYARPGVRAHALILADSQDSAPGSSSLACRRTDVNAYHAAERGGGGGPAR